MKRSQGAPCSGQGEPADLVIWKRWLNGREYELELMNTFVELESEPVFDVELCDKIVLVELGMDDISQRRRANEWICRCHRERHRVTVWSHCIGL